MIRTPGISKREPRTDVRKPAVVVNSDGMEIDALILDISSNGFRLEVDDELRIGEFVSLRVDDELVQAQIRWVLGKEAGGTFLSAVDLSTL
jgi:hypothetical protein